MRKTRILVIDDSALMRRLLTEIIQSQPDMEVIGTAPDPLVAREKIKALAPDVLTLDVEMPHMDGIEFLGHLMRLRPMPVVMVSSLTERGSDMALQALELGAVDVVAKPRLGVAESFHACAEDICSKLRVAAQARPRTATTRAATTATSARLGAAARRHVIAVGASTGGTEALRDFLIGLPADCPPVLMVQHMPAGFTRGFAQRLDRSCALNVSEAVDGQLLEPGCAYLAPGHAHLRMIGSATGWRTALSEEAPVNRHRPAVDVLFHSVARHAGQRAVGVILTGMGRDGAEGLVAMREAGAPTFAQDEASCVVFGMPREAINRGAVQHVLTLDAIAPAVVAALASSPRDPFKAFS
ncbi:protein-glutamate methylesterase/protein-glutamine glutaminase [Variovorax sp. VNK109]|jgi:two-component system chemotaxis response regulator CheB|uniref:protein-glutamate methylesterase/protein-glutamine glutaminase n=1 Tax=Variovorax sp. VNK109 TaxID=3400919 RepID=UPI003BFF4E54